MRQCFFCSSASHHSSNEAAPSCLYSSDAMTAMAVNDSKYENDESIGLFGFGRSEVPELLREGCGRGKFQGHYIAAPRCGLQAQEGKVSGFLSYHLLCSQKREMFFQVTLILFFLKLMLIGLGYLPFLIFSFWQAKPRPPDKPGSLALVKDRNNHREVECTPPRVPTVLGNVRALLSSFRRRLLGRESPSHSSSLNRRNYRDGCPGDPAKAIGSEPAGASLQAQEEKVSGFLFYHLLCSRKREMFTKVTSFLFFLELMLIGLGYLPFLIFSFLAGEASTAR